jgi:4-amino-4-deoxy-L-arabinose transferase-like glycosyltransferase
MKKNWKKGIVWVGVIASMILVLNVFHYFLSGASALAAGPHGHGHGGLMGPRGGFVHQQMMMGSHHGVGFSWFWFLLFLLLGIVVLVLIMKAIRKKSKASSMQQFIDTSLVSSHRPLTNQNASVLDQWEKNIATKKENN